MASIGRFRRSRGFSFAGLLAVVAGAALPMSLPAGAAEDVWSDLKGDLFGDREILDGAGWLVLEAPYRAEDAAMVPISILALRPQRQDSYIKTITLVIDQNPAPVAAVIHFQPRSGVASISTRIRVNAYGQVRAIAETNRGELHMATKFVKASGGCSAPAGKDHEAVMENLGQMRFRQFSAPPSAEAGTALPDLREAQLLIRHPNYSGLQMDQITRNYTPAHFVRDIEVRLGDDLLFSVEAAISLSENPSFRFFFPANGADSLSARIVDTEDRIFSKTWTIKAPAGPAS